MDGATGSAAVALALLASVALVLTVVGLHGTMAYAALRRTGEFGIRFALGATRGDVLLAIVRESLGIVSMGSALGVAGTLALAPVPGRLLYHVGRIDAPSAIAAVLPRWRLASSPLRRRPGKHLGSIPRLLYVTSSRDSGAGGSTYSAPSAVEPLAVRTRPDAGRP